MDRFLYRI